MEDNPSQNDDKPNLLGWAIFGLVKGYWYLLSSFMRLMFGILTPIILAPLILVSAFTYLGSIKIFGEDRVRSAFRLAGIIAGALFVIMALGSLGDGYQDNYNFESFGFRR